MKNFGIDYNLPPVVKGMSIEKREMDLGGGNIQEVLTYKIEFKTGSIYELWDGRGSEITHSRCLECKYDILSDHRSIEWLVAELTAIRFMRLLENRTADFYTTGVSDMHECLENMLAKYHSRETIENYLKAGPFNWSNEGVECQNFSMLES